METVSKFESKLDEIVKRFGEQHKDMTEPEIHARLASTSKEYKEAYREAQYAKDVATAKQSTLLFGADRIAKTERSEQPMRSSAGQILEDLADAYAAEHKVDKAKAYVAVLKSDEGKDLYRESLKAQAAVSKFGS
jgi:hypothetical protein